MGPSSCISVHGQLHCQPLRWLIRAKRQLLQDWDVEAEANFLHSALVSLVVKLAQPPVEKLPQSVHARVPVEPCKHTHTHTQSWLSSPDSHRGRCVLWKIHRAWSQKQPWDLPEIKDNYCFKAPLESEGEQPSSPRWGEPSQYATSCLSPSSLQHDTNQDM